MLKKKDIGKIQIWMGTFFIILAIVGAFLAYNFYVEETRLNFERLEDASSQWRELLLDDNVSNHVSKMEVNVHQLGSMMAFFALVVPTVYLIMTLTVVIILLGIMIILQGLANHAEE